MNRAAWVATAVATLLLGGCAGGVMDPKGPVGQGNRQIIVDATLIMLFIVVPTILLALWMGWRYRASNTKAEYLPYWSFSGRIEAVVWAIPILVIMFLSGEIWIGSHKLDPFRPLESDQKPVEVQVVSLDWRWLFIYPEEGVASVNELVIPAGRPVHFSITSSSVMNTFFVPQLGSMIYAMNGMVSQLHLQADQPGEFRGISGQFSGDGFSDMTFKVRSLPADQYAGWVSATRGAGPVLDQTAYAGLTHQSRDTRPFTFGAVQPDLFNAIATRQAPPGPGPVAQYGRETTPASGEN
ncbi:ubiquinol oxidase subunit II [Caulobacter sp. 17J65-9]|uniref:ubiquinol oxidase subunit II n=1 Tax=Caulobacter sp. 17J65-9 TaxID=2709382 RepID=UPI001969B594